MSTVEPVILVGDRFQGFATHGPVRTVSQLVQELQHRHDAATLEVTPAQGVNDFDLYEIREAINEFQEEEDSTERPTLNAVDVRLATKKQCHKRKASNVLIANLAPNSSGGASAALRIDADNELLLDHQTGQHVQGMVAVEASRQMFISSSTLLGHCEGIVSPYFVINSLETEFKSFLFPLAAQLHFDVQHERSYSNGARRYGVTIRLVQGGNEVSQSKVDYSIFPAAVIHAMEQEKAELAVSSATRAQ